MIRFIALIITAAAVVNPAAAQTDTTFTYQGELTESGSPANGSYNMDFALWDAQSGGSQVGTSIQFNGLPLSEGLFTVELDFGTSAFDGSQLWLEITVDGNELAPRQPITGAPYSIQTRGIFVDAENNVGIGTSSPAWELEVANLAPGDGAESAVTADDASGAIAAYSSTLPPPFEHYAGRVSLFANAATMGVDVRADSVVGDIRFYTGGFASSNERMRITDAGAVGIGTTTPDSLFALDVVGGVKTSGATGGVDGYSRSRSGVFGSSSSGWAGYFAGDVHITGNLSKGGGGFKIDHPLDPANKYLYHSLVESPDMMNVYNGNVMLDDRGEAIVDMPEWFEALNGEFRYQLTAIGEPAPNLHIAEEITGNRFRIAGGETGMKISWQVTGIRHDVWAHAHRLQVEVAKEREEHGKYIHPAEHGVSEVLGMNYEEEQRMAEELKTAREQAGEMRRNAQ